MSDLEKRLQAIAFARTNPFCYSCYKAAPSGTCKFCGSDDLMRELPGSGVEYGTDWVVKELLEAELTPVDLDEVLAESVRELYGETTKVGWIDVDTVEVLRGYETDWRCALADEESHLLDDGQIWSPDNGATYYWTDDVERFCDENEEGAA